MELVDLPPDLLRLIFRQLSMADVASLMRVCKKWKQVCFELWTALACLL